MGEATFTFRVDEELKSSFATLARERDLSAAQLLRAMMREAVARRREEAEHDAWFRNEVGQAMREADDRTIERVPNETVERNWLRQRDELSRRAGD